MEFYKHIRNLISNFQFRMQGRPNTRYMCWDCAKEFDSRRPCRHICRGLSKNL